MLKRALELVCPPSLTQPAEGAPDTNAAAKVADARARLREAQAARRAAELRVAEEVKGTERVRRVLTELSDAKAALKDAETKFTASAISWAANGARAEIVGDPVALARCEKLRADVYRLEMIVAGAETALTPARIPGESGEAMTRAERQARSALADADYEIHHAVREVLAAEITPKIARAVELHRELSKLMPDIRGFARMTQQNTTFNSGGKEEYRDFAAAYAEITAVGMVTQNDFMALMHPWECYGTTLAADPDAELQ